MRKHIRTGEGSRISACGKHLRDSYFIKSNPESATCLTCRSTYFFNSALLSASRGVRL